MNEYHVLRSAIDLRLPYISISKLIGTKPRCFYPSGPRDRGSPFSYLAVIILGIIGIAIAAAVIFVFPLTLILAAYLILVIVLGYVSVRIMRFTRGQLPVREIELADNT